ncbi:MAG: peptide chain release factor N(5)-glutamine methyltransferase [Burkholderiaceae bacterium]
MPSISHTLATAQERGLERLDSQLLLLHALGVAPDVEGAQRAWLIAHGDDALPAAALSRFDGFVQRRLAGEPVAYITGFKEFYGLTLEVDTRVLIPRPDTETLVSWALELLAALSLSPGQVPAVLDLGTGSGAIALALKQQRPDLQVDAIDASAEALAVAVGNAQRLGLSIGFRQGHWLASVTRRYHCIVANPPYVAERDSHLAALAHEPASALVSGVDGLRDLRHIVDAASAFLYPGAWLLLEHGFDQGLAVRELLFDAGYGSVQTRRDLGGNERCTGGQALPFPVPARLPRW